MNIYPDDDDDLSPEETEAMMNTMDATFDDESKLDIKPARPASDNDSRNTD